MLACARRGAPLKVDAALRLTIDGDVEKARTKTGRRAAVRIVASAADMVMSRRIIWRRYFALLDVFLSLIGNWHKMCLPPNQQKDSRFGR